MTRNMDCLTVSSWISPRTSEAPTRRFSWTTSTRHQPFSAISWSEVSMPVAQFVQIESVCQHHCCRRMFVSSDTSLRLPSSMIWRDTKPVLTLSNFHDPTDVGQVKRRTTEGYRQNVNAPKCLADYQENKKGIDLLDQMIGYYMFKEMVA